MAHIELTKDNFDEVIKNEAKILVDFWAPWCGPCRAMGAVIEEFEKAHPDAVVGKFNTDEDQSVPERFGVQGIPTLLIFEAGQLVEKTVGAMGLEDLEDFYGI